MTEEQKARYKAILENEAIRRECPRHYFDLGEDYTTPRNHYCKKCGGYMDPVQIKFYVEGYMASGKPGTDIVKDWDK